MPRATARQRAEFIHLLMKHATITPATVTADSPEVITEGDIQRTAERLLRYGATLGRIAETECNSPDYPAFAWQMPETERLAYFKQVDERYQRELDRLAAKEQRIREKVTALCARIGCKPVFSGDPRGNTLKIQVPSGKTNDWGQQGICVPTS